MDPSFHAGGANVPTDLAAMTATADGSQTYYGKKLIRFMKSQTPCVSIVTTSSCLFYVSTMLKYYISTHT